VLGVVENMSYFSGDDGKQYRIFGEGGGQALAKKFNTKLLAQMPLVPQVREGGDAGTPVVTQKSLVGNAADAAVKFRELARKVAQEIVLSQQGAGAKPSLEIGSFSAN
jgi:ATP-binding protein involved in chromosome partitioning